MVLLTHLQWTSLVAMIALLGSKAEAMIAGVVKRLIV
jgi:hypothetical protein